MFIHRAETVVLASRTEFPFVLPLHDAPMVPADFHFTHFSAAPNAL